MINKIWNPTIFKSLGLCVLLFPAAYSQAVDLSPLPNSHLSEMNVLLMQDKTTGAHHESALIVEGYWQEFSNQLGFDLTITSNNSDINSSNLANYDILVFNYTTNVADGNNNFTSNQRSALQEYMENGGHWIGYHTASMPREGQWDWYRHNVILGLYNLPYHGLQDGTMNKTTDETIRNHPIMTGMPESVDANDEWYNLAHGDYFDEANVMYYIDENTMDGHDHADNLPPEMLALPIAQRHPIMWYRENPSNGGRQFYTGLIHNPVGAGSDWFKLIVLRSAEYVSGIDPDVPGCPDPAFIEFNPDRTSDDSTLCENLGINDKAGQLGDYIKFKQASEFIEFKAWHPGNYRLTLQDASGKVLFQKDLQNNTRAQIPTLDLKAGIYFVTTLRNNKAVAQQKFAISK